MNRCILFLFLVAVNISRIYAVNEISVRHDLEHQTKPGYITSATLSIEPQGGYVSEALYVEYSDHGQFSGSNVEIIHRFNLPKGAVVRDLWLWTGDSIMQAQIRDTWTARHVYDSITSFKRDPAFLNVVDGQYELRIYPLESGNIRKIKMEFLVPVLFMGEQARADLPLSFLTADNNSTTPLRILFRYDARLEYRFSIAEADSLEYRQLPDTLGMHYYESTIADSKAFSSLTALYHESFTDGISCSRETAENGSIYSIGISPAGIFNPAASEPSHDRLCLGIDLNGNYPSSCFKKLLEGTAIFSDAVSGRNDSNKIIITGYGLIDTLPKTGLMSSADLKDVLESFIGNSAILSAVKNRKKPRLLFCDEWAVNDWSYPGLEELAECDTVDNLMSAIPKLSGYDIVAAIKHGNGENLSDENASTARNRIVEFVKNGGYFLTYYDQNRSPERIASNLIEGLKLPTGFSPSNLTRASGGNISSGFPNSFYYYSSCPLEYTDNQVVKELVNSDGKPVVISKKYGSGLFVVSGMWPPHDDAGLKQQVHPALLGLQISGNTAESGDTSTVNGVQTVDIMKMLSAMNDEYHFDNIVLMSSADASVNAENIGGTLAEIDTAGIKSLPRTCCISLLDGVAYTPPTFTSSGTTYYGSGYLLSKIAELTGGMYFGLHEYDWRTVFGLIMNNSSETVNDFSCVIKGDGTEIPQTSIMQPNTLNDVFNSSRFYTFQCASCETIEADITGRSPANDSTLRKILTISTQDIMTRERSILSTEHANDVLLKMLQSVPLDTAAIVSFSVAHRLMNDFTAFIALEPDDSLSFMQNPNDESSYPRTKIVPQTATVNVRAFAVRIQKTMNTIFLMLAVPHTGDVQIRVFTIAGRQLFNQDLPHCGSGSITVPLTKRHFSKGMYIVAVKYLPQGMSHSSLQTRVEKFTVQ